MLGLGRSEDPTFTVKVMLVKAIWPGATSTETLNLVTDKLEKSSRKFQILITCAARQRPARPRSTSKSSSPSHQNRFPTSGTRSGKRCLTSGTRCRRVPKGHSSMTSSATRSGSFVQRSGDGFTHREMRDEMRKNSRDACCGYPT